MHVLFYHGEHSDTYKVAEKVKSKFFRYLIIIYIMYILSQTSCCESALKIVSLKLMETILKELSTLIG